MSARRRLARYSLAMGFALATLPTGALVSAAESAQPCSPRIIDVGTLGGQHSGIYGSDQNGDWVGSADDSAGLTHAVLWHHNRLVDLGVTDAWAADVSRDGVVVGNRDWSAAPVAFVWQGGSAHDLPVPSDTSWRLRAPPERPP